MNIDVPDIVVRRLPIYLRVLRRLQAEGVEETPSHMLAKTLGISAARIRKDFSHFGEFGQQGRGYQVKKLTVELQRILHVDNIWPLVIVGVGQLGHALAMYDGFQENGFRIVALFDNDPAKVGMTVNNVPIQHIDYLEGEIRRHQLQIAVLAVPASQAEAIADRLVAAGIKGILNYANITLRPRPGVIIQQIDPTIILQHMTYYLEQPRN